MTHEWSESNEKDFEKHREEDMITAYRMALILGATLFPFFSGLDYFTQRSHFETLSAIRYLNAALFLVLLLLERRRVYPGSPTLASIFILISAALGITLMCVVTGGHESHYYAGLNLVIVASALFPWRAGHTAAVSGATLGMYGVAMALHAGERFADFPTFINNLYFLVSMAAIATAVTWLSNRLRRRGFRAVLERRALEARDQFISEASHEMRTPLTALQLQIGLLERKLAAGTAPRQELTSDMTALRRQSRRLSKLVDEMLDLSRIRAGKFQMHLVPIDLSATVRETIELQQPHFSAEGVQLTSVVEPELKVKGDEFRLEQVITNLLSNSLKYGDRKPVTLRAWAEGEQVCVEVQDEGIGIPEEQQPLLFERFERASAPANITGLGLGLFITRQIVHGHSGVIDFRSRTGEGTAFTVRLPRL